MKKHKILKNFGERVKKLRIAQGLSQEALGEKAGLHRTYIGSIERYERNISLLNIERLSKALKITPSKLIDFK
ncbi:helix-turn-helix domain-containing protein [Candidatus Omnitrophota bacterium]